MSEPLSDPLSAAPSESDPALVRRVARLARLGLPPDEVAAAGLQLATILEHFRALQDVDTRDVAPLVHAVDRPGAAAEDVICAFPDPRRTLLALTASAREGFFVVPRVLDADFGAGAAGG